MSLSHRSNPVRVHRARRLAPTSPLRPLVLALCLAGLSAGASAATSTGAVADTALPTMTLVKGTVDPTKSTVVQSADGTFTDPSKALNVNGLLTMTVTQTSPKAVWTTNDFSVGAAAAFRNVSGAGTDTLIRVTGGTPSGIYGQVSADNRLWLVNPNGIYVGPKGTVSASSLLMSASDLDPDEIQGGYQGFMAGKPLRLTGAGFNDFSGGYIVVAAGGRVQADDSLVLVAPNYIHNQGVIVRQTRDGSSRDSVGEATMIVAGQTEVAIGDSGYLTLSLTGEETVNGNAQARLLFNEGTVRNDEGRVQLIVAGSGNDTTVLSRAGLSPDGSALRNEGSVIAQGSKGANSVLMQVMGPRGSLVQQGLVDVSALEGATSAKGGTIDLVANTILLPSPNADLANGVSVMRADGPAGGGQINLVAAPDTATPSITVGDGAVLSASALTAGDGGSIRVLGSPNVPLCCSYGADSQTPWATFDATAVSRVSVQGQLAAHGGASSGNGGSIVLTGTQVDISGVSAANGAASTADKRFDVSAGNSTGKAGWWSLYAPQITIGTQGALAAFAETYSSDNSPITSLWQSDLSQLLSSGANVRLVAYADDHVTIPYVRVLDGTEVTSTYGGSQELFIGSVADVRIGDGNGGVVIESTKGPMDITLQADVDGNQMGVVRLIGTDPANVDAVRGMARAQSFSGGTSVALITQGGNITVTGRAGETSRQAYGDAVALDRASLNANGGNVKITGAGNLFQGDGIAIYNGVTLHNTDINAGNIQILGTSPGATGVSLSNVGLSTSTNGSIVVAGRSSGQAGTTNGSMPIGVMYDQGEVRLGSAGQFRLAGLGQGGRNNDAIGVAVRGLDIATQGVAANGAVPRITLAGESTDSRNPGLSIGSENGIVLHDLSSSSAPSNADVVIGAKAGALAQQALALGGSSFLTTGRLNIRPLSVSITGELLDDAATPIYLGTRPEVESFDTNFIVAPGLFQGAYGPGLNIVVGSSAQTGRITVADHVLSDQSTVTLQNQGTNSAGIVLGAQGGEVITPSKVSGQVTAQALEPGQTLSRAGVINLVTEGNISQTGPILAQAVNVVAGTGSTVALNNPGNSFATTFVSGGTSVDVAGGVTPSSSSAVTAFDAAADRFVTISSTTQPERNPDNTIPDMLEPSKTTIESTDVLQDLRTDVYVRGQMSRPQVCTPGNTGGTVIDVDGEALAQQWLQVRRSAQLSNCSGLRNDNSCAAF